MTALGSIGNGSLTATILLAADSVCGLIPPKGGGSAALVNVGTMATIASDSAEAFRSLAQAAVKAAEALDPQCAVVLSGVRHAGGVRLRREDGEDVLLCDAHANEFAAPLVTDSCGDESAPVCQYSGHDAYWPCAGIVDLYQQDANRNIYLCENAIGKAKAAGVDVQPVPFASRASS